MLLLEANQIKYYVQDRLLVDMDQLQIHQKDRIGLVGRNGSGKTTLIKKIMNQSDGITLSPSVKIGYFSQNLNILDVEESILENVQSSSKQDETLIQTVLARMHFFRADVYKLVGVLSGGERVKVALAKLFLSDINTLILDEPTNFLDTEAIEALESLLQEYKGTIIFVSHDRRFIENLATRIVIIHNKKIELFEGNYDQYINHEPQTTQDTEEDKRLLLETKISEVLSRLSIESSEELEVEFQKLLQEKRKLNSKR